MTPAAGNAQHYFGNNNNQYSADSAETPKYIKNLRTELNISLKKNLELRLKIE